MVRKERYRVFATLGTTETDITLFTAEDDVLIDRVILELDLIPNGVDTAGVTAELVLGKAPGGTKVSAPTAPETQDGLGPVPEEEMWRRTYRFDANSANTYVGRAVIEKDFKTSRELTEGDKFLLSHDASLASKLILAGIVTMMILDVS